MAIDRANFGKLMEPGLRKIYFEEYEARPAVHEQVFKVEGSDKKTETDYRIAGLGSWDEKAEGADVAYEDIRAGDEVTYTHTTYAKGIQVTEEMMEDNQYPVLKNMTKELGRTAKITVEQNTASVFNNGFSSSYLGYDSKALFADDHPDRGAAAGTQDNKGTSALADAALKTAIIAMRKQENEAGQLIDVNPDQLIVPDDLEFTALEITQSALKTGTGNNDVNTLRGRLKVVVWGYLTDTNNWFLRDGSVAANCLFWRVKPMFRSEGDFDSGNGKFQGRMRFKAGWSDWRGLYGSEVA
jgi:phage major head subunit gpT-like protein